MSTQRLIMRVTRWSFFAVFLAAGLMVWRTTGQAAEEPADPAAFNAFRFWAMVAAGFGILWLLSLAARLDPGAMMRTCEAMPNAATRPKETP